MKMIRVSCLDSANTLFLRSISWMKQRKHYLPTGIGKFNSSTARVALLTLDKVSPWGSAEYYEKDFVAVAQSDYRSSCFPGLDYRRHYPRRRAHHLYREMPRR